MVKDAEEHAAEDSKRKEEAEKAEALEAEEARAELKDLKKRYQEHLWGEEGSEGK